MIAHLAMMDAVRDTVDAQRHAVELRMELRIRPRANVNIVDLIARRGRRRAPITSYGLLNESRRSSVAASEPPTSSDENEREDEDAEDLSVNYRRKGFRRDDYMNEDAVVCYDSNTGPYVRSASKLNTITNSDRLFITSGDGLVHVHNRVADFFFFLVHDSGQAARGWGHSLNLGNPGALEEIIGYPGVRRMAQKLLGVTPGVGENSAEGSLFDLIVTIMVVSKWDAPSRIHHRRTVAGGHFAYSRVARDRNTTRSAAIVAEIDTLLQSEDNRRRIVFESKRPGNLPTATEGSAMVQMYTGVLGLRASVGILSTGTQFGLFWFEYHRSVRIHKVLDIHDLIELDEDAVDKLIKLAAHLAFYVSDPLELIEPVAKKACVKAPGVQVTGKKGRRETTQATNAAGKVDKARKSGNSSATSKADAWEELTIEGPTGKTAVCTMLREDIDEETRAKILGEIEPEF